MPKAVIFDIGGVLVDWQPHYLFEEHFPGDAAGMRRFFDEVLREVGLATCEAPFAEVMPDAHARFPEHSHLLEIFERDWHGFLGDPIHDSVALFHALEAKGVPLYGLTNWPAETYPPRGEDFHFLGRFKDIVVSGEVRLRKPDPAIYHLALETFGLSAEEALFVDDLHENVVAAHGVGLHGHHFQGAEGLAAELREHGFI